MTLNKLKRVMSSAEFSLHIDLAILDGQQGQARKGADGPSADDWEDIA